MKRFALLFVSLLFAGNAFAQTASSPQPYKFRYESLTMRNTTAASSVARNGNWADVINAAGFTDSSVFRRGVTTATVYDTSVAYRTADWPLPPSLGVTLANALADTASVPWILVRVRQDSTSFAFTGTCGMDSVRVAAEYSPDGVNWSSCSGTPTQRFDTVFMTSGQDGLQSPTLVGVEGAPGDDFAFVKLKCHPSQVSSNAFIIDRSLCMSGSFVRFIIGGDYSGQFVTEVGHW